MIIRQVMKFPLILSMVFFAGLIPRVHAHCPLCTVGAGVLGGGAMWLGINPSVVGLFIGAAAVALGLFINKMITKRFRFQEAVVVLGSFLLTILPLIPLLGRVTGLPIYFIGTYGSVLNRVYVVDLFLIGSVVGGVVMLIIPLMSKQLTTLRNEKKIPYQMMILSFTTMLVLAVFFQTISP